MHMNTKQIIKAVAKDTGVSAVVMSEQMGKSPHYISSVVTHYGIKVPTFVEILNAYGYEIIIKPKGSGRRPEGSYILGDEE